MDEDEDVDVDEDEDEDVVGVEDEAAKVFCSSFSLSFSRSETLSFLRLIAVRTGEP